jgi:hypothetical protein
MVIMRTTVAALCVLLSLSAVQAEPQEKTVERVSVIRLVSNANAYDGKEVFVTGYLTLGVERNLLCLSSDAASSMDCLWVELDDGPWESKEDEHRLRSRQKEWRTYDKQLVSVRATLDKNNTGHLGSTHAALTKVTQVYGRQCQTLFKPASTQRTCSKPSRSSN